MPTYAILGATGSTGSSLLSYLLERPSSASNTPLTVNVYARSLSKIPSSYRSSPNAHFFTGDLSPSTLKTCLTDTDVIFQCLAQNIAGPGCSIAQRAAHAIVEALESIRREAISAGEKPKCPTVVLLSSASLNPTFSAEIPRILRWVLDRGNYYVYTDLRQAIFYLVEQAPWIPLIRAEPPALVHDMPRGFELREDSLRSHTIFLSYDDLARGMVAMVEGGDGGAERWIGKPVGICGMSKDVKKDVLPLIKYQLTGLLAYFLPSVWNLGTGRLW